MVKQWPHEKYQGASICLSVIGVADVDEDLYAIALQSTADGKRMGLAYHTFNETGRAPDLGEVTDAVARYIAGAQRRFVRPTVPWRRTQPPRINRREQYSFEPPAHQTHHPLKDEEYVPTLANADNGLSYLDLLGIESARLESLHEVFFRESTSVKPVPMDSAGATMFQSMLRSTKTLEKLILQKGFEAVIGSPITLPKDECDVLFVPNPPSPHEAPIYHEQGDVHSRLVAVIIPKTPDRRLMVTEMVFAFVQTKGAVLAPVVSFHPSLLFRHFDPGAEFLETVLKDWIGRYIPRYYPTDGDTQMQWMDCTTPYRSHHPPVQAAAALCLARQTGAKHRNTSAESTLS